MAVDKSAFFKISPASLPVHEFPFPEGGPGATVCMRELGALDWRTLKASTASEQVAGEQFSYSLLARTLCGPDGVLLFTGAPDMAESFALSLRTLKRLVEQALEINDLGGAEKNLPPRSATPTPSASCSDTPTPTISLLS